MVRGRGAVHQVDALGEFAVVPPFSSPIRLFVEAKSQRDSVGLAVVRNAMGTISDVNQAWMLNYSNLRIRRLYRYALFSTSGFSGPAQEYGLAHQISLVDLSGSEWEPLRRIAVRGAEDLLNNRLGNLRLRAIRSSLRQRLGTTLDDAAPPDTPENLQETLHEVCAGIADQLEEELGPALIACPTGSQVLLARADDLRQFLRWSVEYPTHQVRMNPVMSSTSRTRRTWTIQPVGDVNVYSLTITLPRLIEQRLSEESDRRSRTLAAKSELGGQIEILWDPQGATETYGVGGPRIFRLVFTRTSLLA